MASIEDHIKDLHDKYFHEKITPEEEEELISYFEEQGISRAIVGDFLYTSHPDYGKPGKDGIIRIV